MEKKEDQQENRFTYSDNIGLRILSEKESIKDGKEKPDKKDNKKIEKSHEYKYKN